MQAHEAQVDHFAGDVADLHAIADPNAVFADEEEVADDRHEHALHRDGEAGGEEAGERDERARSVANAKPTIAITSAQITILRTAAADSAAAPLAHS